MHITQKRQKAEYYLVEDRHGCKKRRIHVTTNMTSFFWGPSVIQKNERMGRTIPQSHYHMASKDIRGRSDVMIQKPKLASIKSRDTI